MKFNEGDRVICTNPRAHLSSMTGYYGHVEACTKVMILVSLQGRIGGSARPENLDSKGGDPFCFYPDELEHAD